MGGSNPLTSDSIRRQAQADEAATERRMAALHDEITRHEQHLEEVRRFLAMLDTYQAPNAEPRAAQTVLPSRTLESA
jgi:hypothetical protein